jgi:UTP--glucose-1-phosphate uridylyltransferase
MVANLDNLGATLDETLLGFHLAHGQPVTCEVVDKLGSDRGGIPVRWNGRPVVLEEFRLPSGFDPNQVRVFNTNTFTFDARALLELAMDWTFFVVQKQVDGKAVLQFERLIGEVTSVLATRFVRVPRAGAQSRFLPVKDNEELAQRRAEITRVARARGMLPAG